jgi:RNA polymerase sigma-70 factor (sigma-E family)
MFETPRGIERVQFVQFVQAHSRSLFGTAFLLTGTADAAEELLQDTLVALYPKWEQVVAADAPLAYVRRALVNRFAGDRRGPRSRVFSVWDVPEGVDRGDLADRVSDRELIWQLLAELPLRQRAAIVLRYFYDQSDEAIGAALSCRTGTVRSLISRGVQAMRQTGDARLAALEGDRS